MLRIIIIYQPDGLRLVRWHITLKTLKRTKIFGYKVRFPPPSLYFGSILRFWKYEWADVFVGHVVKCLLPHPIASRIIMTLYILVKLSNIKLYYKPLNSRVVGTNP